MSQIADANSCWEENSWDSNSWADDSWETFTSVDSGEERFVITARERNRTLKHGPTDRTIKIRDRRV